MTPEEMVARLLYRDGLMLVIDKPAGLAVHRGPKGGESLEDHFGALRFGLPRSPSLAHRLDRDTSGCLVLGRHRKALAELGRLFKGGRIGKTYWAVVEGGPTEDEGRIELALARRDETRGWWMKVDPAGQPSATAWKVMGRGEFGSAVADASVANADVAPANTEASLANAGTTSFPPPLWGRGGERGTQSLVRVTPLPVPPPQGGRERCGASLRDVVRSRALKYMEHIERLVNDLECSALTPPPPAP